MASFGTRFGGIAVCFACLAIGSFVGCPGAFLPSLMKEAFAMDFLLMRLSGKVSTMYPGPGRAVKTQIAMEPAQCGDRAVLMATGKNTNNNKSDAVSRPTYQKAFQIVSALAIWVRFRAVPRRAGLQGADATCSG